METFQELGEFGFIDRIAQHKQGGDVLCGIGDDCAVFALDAEWVRLVTTDMMVESIHFTQTAGPEGLGYKLLAVNLSDVAAMGGTPTDAVVSVSVPADLDAGYLERVYNGLFACAEQFGVVIAGGDTTKSPGPLVLNLTLSGKMLRDRVCYRSGARPGDRVYVSGSLGDSGAGLVLADASVSMDNVDLQFLIRRHHRPEPRVALGAALAKSGAVTAMMDVSDGVASDLRHICRASQVNAVIREASVPLSGSYRTFCEATRRRVLDLALSGGEDYELLFTVDPDRVDAVERLGASTDFPLVSEIGQIEEGQAELFLEDENGRRAVLTAKGFDHFR
ncbi:MAG: thiamine-phosphate kinase [bacterium]|nr:thiamine-phosphate kinase [bacterium]